MVAPLCRTGCAPDMRIISCFLVPLVPLLRPCGPPTQNKQANSTRPVDRRLVPHPLPLLTTTLPESLCPQQPSQAYANSLVDHHLILDLVPPLAANYFAGRLPAPLSYSQAAILAAVGLQQHEIGKVGGNFRKRRGRLAGQCWRWFDCTPPTALFTIIPQLVCAPPRPCSWRRRWTCPHPRPWHSSTRCEISNAAMRLFNAPAMHAQLASSARLGVVLSAGFLKCRAPVTCLRSLQAACLRIWQAAHACSSTCKSRLAQPLPTASASLARPPQALRRLHGLLRAAKEAEAERSLPRPAMAAAAARAAQLAPHEAELDAELDEAAEVRSLKHARLHLQGRAGCSCS